MYPQLRTEIQVRAWEHCQRCWKPTLVNELVGRPIGMSTVRHYNLFGFQVGEYHHTQMVGICPTCEWQRIEAEKARRARTLLAMSGGAVMLFGWQYMGLLSLIPAALVVLAGAFLRRNRQRALTIRGEQ